MIITINDDLSSHIISDDKLQECFLPDYNPETLLPFSNKEEVEVFINTTLSSNYFIPYKSPEEREAEAQAIKITNNIYRAKQELINTDWCENASVRNTLVTPHLTNTSEFDDYRLEACTQALEKVIQTGNTLVTALIQCWDEPVKKQGKKISIYNTYKLLINAGFHEKAEVLRSIFFMKTNVDLAEEPIKG